VDTVQSSEEGIGPISPQDFDVFHTTSMQQVLEKLSRKTYTFKKKGCEDQFLFNDQVNDRINSPAESCYH